MHALVFSGCVQWMCSVVNLCRVKSKASSHTAPHESVSLDYRQHETRPHKGIKLLVLKPLDDEHHFFFVEFDKCLHRRGVHLQEVKDALFEVIGNYNLRPVLSVSFHTHRTVFELNS